MGHMTRSSITLTQPIIDYINQANRDEHEALKVCREETANHPRAKMQISPEQGSFMSFLIRLIDARIAVEVGVFTGYSALVSALALRANAGPGAKLFALDMSHEYIKIANKYWEMASMQNTIEPRVGQAIDSLQKLLDEGYKGRVDFIFIDADKAKYPQYYEKALELLRVGGLMLFDNMLREGKVTAPADDDKASHALIKLAQDIKNDKRVDCNFVGVGDGILMVKKN